MMVFHLCIKFVSLGVAKRAKRSCAVRDYGLVFRNHTNFKNQHFGQNLSKIITKISSKTRKLVETKMPITTTTVMDMQMHFLKKRKRVNKL